MRHILLFILIFSTGPLFAQQQQQFIPAPISAYGNVLQYHYSQSQWYYKELVEQEFDARDLTLSSQRALNAMLNVRPKTDKTISILDVYKQEQIKQNNFYRSK
jgi:hypothetical protein